MNNTIYQLHLPKSIIGCLLVLSLAASCKGQGNMGQPVPPAPGAKAADHPRLVKTLGSDQYQELRCGITDKDGNLWLGTTGEGVYRYNGKDFTQFTTHDGLGSNTVWAILQDRSGKIWLGTDAGLYIYDGKSFVRIPMQQAAGYYASMIPPENEKENPVWAMLEDKDGMLWFCTMKGVYRYNGVAFSRFPDNGGVLNKDQVRLEAVGCILQDNKGNIWFGSGVAGGDGICCYDGHSLKSVKPAGDTWIRYMVEDKKANIWFGTRSHGVWRYDGKDFVPYKDKTDIGAPMAIDKEGNIWFGGEEHDNGYNGKGGIWRYDGRSFTNFTAKDGMGDYSVWCIFEDHSGNIWIGTRNTGLYRYNGTSFSRFSE